MTLDRGAGIDIERRADRLGDLRQADIFGVQHAVAIFKMIHGR
jgi:hypothetical protein